MRLIYLASLLASAHLKFKKHLERFEIVSVNCSLNWVRLPERVDRNLHVDPWEVIENLNDEGTALFVFATPVQQF